MQEIIAGLEQFTFTFEKDVEMQKGTGLLPFQGMDKSGSAVCNFFAKGLCEKGKLCPLRHNRGEKMVVCKHWLRGLCKKGDQCNFLHQYDVTRMPECYFYSKFGDCNNKECPFLHVKPAFKTRDCPWYDQGFCKDGPLCKHRHVRKIMCANYFVGFCPEGPRCQFAHSLSTGHGVQPLLLVPGSLAGPLPRRRDRFSPLRGPSSTWSPTTWDSGRQSPARATGVENRAIMPASVERLQQGRRCGSSVLHSGLFPLILSVNELLETQQDWRHATCGRTS
ncbi:putative cleavage and polyadenylation specificity factor subunit 4-like protein isoform X2 [Felis catus]|uniref:putative cleavage and polyadenylation specificity factor subunit 4-like protein isoform X2 n=1 Tax=Felis catus TaxID=9685 RepID=UPI001D1A3077|nr:putative cleavage and polyadenylation specificity factor subunit 4-like protein isoform X2 [Felis catus]